MVVVDSSIFVKWFVPEKDSDKAIQLRAAHIAGNVRLATLDLAFWEVANTLRFPRPVPTAEEIGAAIRSMMDLGLQAITPTPDLVQRAAQLALSRNLTVYDASFAALALELGYPLVSADDDLVERTRDLGISHRLREWRPPSE